jgi:hypothetical protein
MLERARYLRRLPQVIHGGVSFSALNLFHSSTDSDSYSSFDILSAIGSLCDLEEFFIVHS